MKALKKAAVIILLTTIHISAQDNQPKHLTDTSEVKIPLTLRNIDTYALEKIVLSDINYSQFFIPKYSSQEENASFDRIKLKKELLSNFKQYMDWQRNYDLGVFGEVLGYAQAAVVAGLAIKHITKYKGKAFFKRK